MPDKPDHPDGPQKPDSSLRESGPSTATTWALLLSKWTQLAQAAVAVRHQPDGGRWEASVPALIGLQATTFALGELHTLDAAERAVGLDKAAFGIRQFVGQIHEAWKGVPMPEGLASAIDDARLAHEGASALGQEWVVDSDIFEMPEINDFARALSDAGFAGDVFAAWPGTLLMRGCPAIFVAPGLPASVALERALGRDSALRLFASQRLCVPRQVYRQTDDETGLAVRDVVAPLLTTLPPGRPLLLPVLQQGVVMPLPLPAQTEQWKGAQSRALGDRKVLPVVFEGAPEEGGDAGEGGAGR